MHLSGPKLTSVLPQMPSKKFTKVTMLPRTCKVKDPGIEQGIRKRKRKWQKREKHGRICLNGWRDAHVFTAPITNFREWNHATEKSKMINNNKVVVQITAFKTKICGNGHEITVSVVDIQSTYTGICYLLQRSMIICQYSVENNKLNYPSSQNFEPLLQTSIQILGHINITAYNHCYKNMHRCVKYLG